MARRFKRDHLGLWHDAKTGQFNSGPKRKPDLRHFPKAPKPAKPRKRKPKAPPPPVEFKRPETPREAKNEFAGAVRKSRRVKVPPIEAPRTGTVFVSKFQSEGILTIGQSMTKAGAFEAIRGIRAGTRVRITVVGELEDGTPITDSREFTMGFGLDGQRLKHANQIMFHALGILGKDFFEVRGRGYDILGENDAMEWTIEVIPEAVPE